MGLLKDFKDFALKGNVFDMAVGVIIGGAFAKLTGSFVNDLMMPPVASLSGKAKSMADKFIALDGGDYKSAADAMAAGAPIIKYGSFINNCIDFFLMAVAVFILVKIVASLQRTKAVVPEPTATEKLLAEIRDTLKGQKKT